MKLIDQFISKDFAYYCGDSVQLIDEIPDKSIGFSLWSPPFKDLYVYSNNLEDMGNCASDDEFDFGFQIMTSKLINKIWDGRNVAIHCMDLPIQKGKDGYIGLKDFSGSIIRAMIKSGFIYHSRITLRKSPVTEMQRTKALGLLHKQIKKDAAMSRVGIPDYLLIFRVPGEHLHPVIHQDKDHSLPNYLPVSLWQKYAEPIWDDIDFGNTLNGRNGREDSDEKHICPLSLDIIERSLHLWSNEGDPVLSMFGGIGSEVYKSILLKRKGIAFELKKSYFNEGVQNCINAEKLTNQKTLFNEITHETA